MPTLIQPSFASGEFAPALYGRVDVAKYQVGLRTARNVFVHVQGGVSNRPGTEYVGPVKNHSQGARLIPFKFNTTDTYQLEFGDFYMRVIRNGGHVLEPTVAISDATAANPVVVTATGHGYSDGDDVYITGVVGMTELNGRWFRVANKTANTIELTDQVTGANIDGTGFTAYTSGGTVARVYTVTMPYTWADIATLKFTQNADVMTLTHPSYDVRELSRLTDHDDWSIATVTFTPEIATPTGGSVTPQGAAGSTTYNYKVTAIADEGSEESLPTSALSTSTGNATLDSTNFNRIAWSTVAGAGKYDVYKADGDSGLYGYIGTTEDLQFDDTNYDPDTSVTPPKARTPFAATDDKPGAVTYHEQRRIFGGSNNKPDTWWATQIGNNNNLSVSDPLRDDDAITATLNAREVNEIRHFLSMNDLLVFTSGAEWKINSGQEAAFGPNTVKQKLQSEWGSSHLPPLLIGSDAIWVESSGAYVLSATYTLDSDSYRGPDMTTFAKHLFEGYTLSEWAFAKMPRRLVHAVRSDGQMIVMAFNRDQEVVAWTHYDTNGLYESVSTVREGTEDAVYTIVKRTINGNTVRYIERQKSRYFTTVEDCFFVDCGLTYDGAAAKTISGLDHLEGETVVALADGNVVSGLTVTNGAITLAEAAAKVHVGLSYTSDVETLNVESPQGTIQGKKIKVPEVTVRFEQSRGLWVGPSSDKLVEMKQREFEVMGSPTALLTGDKRIKIKPDWGSNGRLFLRQQDPLPMTILAIIPDVVIGG
jgi:hypothetical protein